MYVILQEYEDRTTVEKRAKNEKPDSMLLVKNDDISSAVQSKQTTISAAFQSRSPYDSKSAEQTKLNYKIFEWMIDNTLPYTVVGSKTYIEMMHQSNPKCCIPSEKYFRTVMMPEIYEKVKARIRMILDQVENVSLTTDMWTSQSKQSYASLTAHFIDEDWNRKTIILG